MIIRYIPNTCDFDGIKVDGEIAVFFKDGKVVYHHDHSDSVLEIDAVASLLEAIGATDITFEEINELSKPDLALVNKYLRKHY